MDRENDYGAGATDSGPGLPAVRRKDWEFMLGVWHARTTVYGF